MKHVLSLIALAAGLTAPAAAQSRYGAPAPGQYRAEQRETARLNAQQDVEQDDYGADDAANAPPIGGDYARDRADYERELAENRRARDDYRRRSAEHRQDLARWRERVAACNDGVREACAGYEERYGSYGNGRYAPPPPVYRGAGRYADGRDWRDDAPPPPPPPSRYRPPADDSYEDGPDGYDDGYAAPDDGYSAPAPRNLPPYR
ncbi:hypothetical protein [Sphingomonas jatrophae]|uniref:Uncharacterized protein n=1 Tax=Sphingomonas jatrophae TaxID=1166337 RepID=A0A1I6LL34_9SPHN|nr:hypothetical protein [Sphingomonas jatrophae]SFS03972.1 hypothetical protein SAMN05192580_2857 [Sphingomonas jatrophae]